MKNSDYKNKIREICRKWSGEYFFFNVYDLSDSQFESIFKVVEGVFEEGRIKGYENVKSWFKNFNYPSLELDSKRCPVCGGKLSTIRGRYPHTPKRKACATCAVEITESIVDNLQANLEGGGKATK